MNNVRLDRAQPDVRRPFVLQDVRALRAKGFFVNGAAAENDGGLKSND